LILQVPKVSVYTKRSSSEALGTSSQQTAPKKIKITQSPQIVDLEEEEPKEKVSMDMVESGTNKEEAGKRSMPQSESISRSFSNKKHIFDKAPGAVYQSKEDLARKYVVKGSLAMSEIRELIPEVENISQHKSSLFTVRDIEKKTLNIAVADEDKVSEVKLHYENISAPDKVKFHRNTSDMLYSDYLGLSLKISRLTTHALKLEGQLRQEKASNRAWQTQVKRLESEGPQGVKASLEEKDKMIQSIEEKTKYVCHRASTNNRIGFSRTRERGISTGSIELQGQSIAAGERKGELVTRTDISIKHGCSCTLYYRNWAKH
jgi:hypothetical protein